MAGKGSGWMVFKTKKPILPLFWKEFKVDLKKDFKRRDRCGKYERSHECEMLASTYWAFFSFCRL